MRKETVCLFVGLCQDDRSEKIIDMTPSENLVKCSSIFWKDLLVLIVYTGSIFGCPRWYKLGRIRLFVFGCFAIFPKTHRLKKHFCRPQLRGRTSLVFLFTIGKRLRKKFLFGIAIWQAFSNKRQLWKNRWNFQMLNTWFLKPDTIEYIMDN